MIYLEKKSVRWCYQITKTTIKVNKIPQVPSILSLLLLWFFYLNLKYVNFECWKQEYDRMIKCWFHIKYVHFFLRSCKQNLKTEALLDSCDHSIFVKIWNCYLPHSPLFWEPLLAWSRTWWEIPREFSLDWATRSQSVLDHLNWIRWSTDSILADWISAIR